MTPTHQPLQETIDLEAYTRLFDNNYTLSDLDNFARKLQELLGLARDSHYHRKENIAFKAELCNKLCVAVAIINKLHTELAETRPSDAIAKYTQLYELYTSVYEVYSNIHAQHSYENSILSHVVAAPMAFEQDCLATLLEHPSTPIEKLSDTARAALITAFGHQHAKLLWLERKLLTLSAPPQNQIFIEEQQRVAKTHFANTLHSLLIALHGDSDKVAAFNEQLARLQLFVMDNQRDLRSCANGTTATFAAVFVFFLLQRVCDPEALPKSVTTLGIILCGFFALMGGYYRINMSVKHDLIRDAKDCVAPFMREWSRVYGIDCNRLALPPEATTSTEMATRRSAAPVVVDVESPKNSGEESGLTLQLI